MLMQSQRNEGTDDFLRGRVRRVSDVYRKRLTRLAAILVAGATALGCGVSEITGPASSAEQPKQLQPSTSTLVQERNTIETATPAENPCDPTQMLLIEGQTRFAIHTTVSATGQIHNYIETRTRGQATRITDAALTDDDVWTADTRDLTEMQLSTFAASEMTIESRDVYIGKGRNPNFLRHTIYHITVSSSGQINARPERSQVKCQT